MEPTYPMLEVQRLSDLLKAEKEKTSELKAEVERLKNAIPTTGDK